MLYHIKFYDSFKAKNYLNHFDNLKKAPRTVSKEVVQVQYVLHILWAINKCWLLVLVSYLEF